MQSNKSKKYVEILKQFQNIIFYGVSGSGKTFNAIQTVENFQDKKVSIAKLDKENRVKFIAFHQLFSYYNFIERKDGETLKNGILKEMAVNASLDLIKNSIKGKSKNLLSTNSKIWKVSLGYRKTEERVYNQAKKDKEIVLGWLENDSLQGKSYNEIYSMLEIKRGNDEVRLTADVASINAVVNDMKIGDFVLIYSDSNHISDIGIINDDYFHDYGTPYPHKRKVTWIKEFETPFNILEYDNKTATDIRTFYELKHIDFSDLRNIMQIENNIQKDSKPYFLIIDNIDKGDILSIFGESFSILDKDKRDNQSILLPLSNKKFSLPSNIYIIGTAENVIKELMIQKRFAFIKTEPIEISKKITLEDGSTFDLSSFLSKINDKLKSRGNSTLGYGFISNINNITDFNNFQNYQLIPFLESLDLNENQIKEFLA